MGQLRNSFLTIGTQRTCDVFRFVHSGCKGCDGEMCMCEIYVGAFFHVATSRIRTPTSLRMDAESMLLRVRSVFMVVLHFGRRCFVLGHACSVQTDQPHQVVWSRIGDVLVIVIDHRLICELPRSCCKQECGDVGISTPNTLRCMHCHTTAPHGLVWFDVRTSRFCSFLIFSFSNFLKLIAAICCWTCL